MLHSGLGALANALRSLGIRFLAGGSVASSVHGATRATMDIDLLVELTNHLVQEFVEAIAGEFYADAEEIAEALARERPFNVIHRATAYKFDLFPVTNDFHLSELKRAQDAELGVDLKVPVASAEDILLAKLVWFRAGGEISDRQWLDIQNIISVQRARLDREYLNAWAIRLDVGDLLYRALPEP